jgi:hypothetical protein
MCIKVNSTTTETCIVFEAAVALFAFGFNACSPELGRAEKAENRK